LSRSTLVKKIKIKNPKLNTTEIETIIDIFCITIQKALRSNKSVQLREFGTFFVKKIKEKYSARNPKTGELIYVPEKNKVRFRASKNLKIKINE
jgi:integration host factor subunit beta